MCGSVVVVVMGGGGLESRIYLFEYKKVFYYRCCEKSNLSFSSKLNVIIYRIFKVNSGDFIENSDQNIYFHYNFTTSCCSCC